MYVYHVYTVYVHTMCVFVCVYTMCVYTVCVCIPCVYRVCLCVYLYMQEFVYKRSTNIAILTLVSPPQFPGAWLLPCCTLAS